MASATSTTHQNRSGLEIVSQRTRSWRVFKRNRTALFGLLMIGVMLLIAVAAPLIAPFDPIDQSVRDRLAGPGWPNILGRDEKGRDILSRIIYGTRVALQVGILSVLLGSTLGTTIGCIAGYVGGKTDAFLMRLSDVMLAFPDLITGLLVLVVFGAGLDKMVLAIGLTIAPRFARISYGPTLLIKSKEFVEAARCSGQSNPRILLNHILPNILGELLVFASLWTASAIRLEASLSFIGLGIPPPTATWGQMIREGTNQLTTAPLYSLAPGIALFVAVLAFNLVGDGLRDIFDPRSTNKA